MVSKIERALLQTSSVFVISFQKVSKKGAGVGTLLGKDVGNGVVLFMEAHNRANERMKKNRIVL